MSVRPPGYPTPNMQQQRFQPQPGGMNRYQQGGYPSPQPGPRPGFGPQMGMGGQMGGGQMGGGQMGGGPMGGGPMGSPMASRLSMGQQGMQRPSHPGPMHPQQMAPHPYPPASSSTSSSSSSSSTTASPAKPATGTGSLQRGMPPPAVAAQMDHRKRAAERISAQNMKNKKKKKVADKILPQRVRDLVPESQAYMDLLAFERKLDATIMRKRLDIQEALKRPQKVLDMYGKSKSIVYLQMPCQHSSPGHQQVKKKLRVFISNTYYPAKQETEDGEETMASWELRVEGRLLEDNPKTSEANKTKRKFSSFFKSLVIELDKDLYGPDNHLVEWHRTPSTQETDGFQVKRPGDQNVKCTVLLMLDYQPMQFKLDQRLARLLGIHTQTRPVIISALWQYVKTHHLQDAHEREYINCDKYLQQIFDCNRMKFSEIPQRLHTLLMPPDPIVINHIITVDGNDSKKTACYDIDVEVDDNLKQQMNNFLLSTQSQQEIATLDNKIHETVETINQLKTSRDFLLGFARDPQEFINNWLVSQTRDLKTMTDVVGNPEEERHADFYHEPWSQEAVCRYFYGKVQQRRAELEQALGIRNT